MDPDYISWYKWMKREMIQRIGPPKIPKQFPFWAWYQYSGATKPRPDLREARFANRKHMGFRLEIQKPASQVLLSDFDIWEHLFHYAYIAADRSDRQLFETQMDQLPPQLEFKNYPESVKASMEASWSRVFDIRHQPFEFLPFEEKSIQATFWELKLEDVVKVDKFAGRSL